MTPEEHRRADVLEAIGDAWGAAESASELLDAVACVLDDAEELGLGAVAMGPMIEALRQVAAARAAAEAAARYMLGPNAVLVAQRYGARLAADYDGTSTRTELEAIAGDMLAEATKEGVGVRAITQCAAAMAAAWRAVR